MSAISTTSVYAQLGDRTQHFAVCKTAAVTSWLVAQTCNRETFFDVACDTPPNRLQSRWRESNPRTLGPEPSVVPLYNTLLVLVDPALVTQSHVSSIGHHQVARPFATHRCASGIAADRIELTLPAYETGS